MNSKRFVLAALAVFVAAQAIEFLVNGVLLKSTYDSLKNLWRPDMDSKMWIFPLLSFLVSGPFVYLFVKGYEGRGLMEGLRFGLVMGVYTSLPAAYATYAMFPLPYSLALEWFLAGMVEIAILGIVAAAVYKPAGASGAAAG